MLCEQRTYQIQPGRAAAFLAFYEARGLPIITRYATLVGCWTKESGILNSIVFLWQYESYAHRSEQRAKLGADPEWQAFIPEMLPFLVHQEATFLVPASFSPKR
jgi:hypothetical protein